MTSQPLISVIVPVYNTEEYLRRCLDSIAQQTYTNLEIICVDDGSSDGSGAILDEYAAKDSRFVVIHKQNAGQAAARNDALAIAKGQWVANVDSDDALELNTYEKVAAHFEDDVEMVWIGNHVECDYDEKLKEQQLQFYTLKWSGKKNIKDIPLPALSGAVWNKIMRRSIIVQNQIRYPHGAIFEDLCFFAQVVPYLHNIYFVPDRLYIYYQRKGSTMDIARSGKSSKSKDAVDIIKPMYEFYARNGLFKTHSAIYVSFFSKFYALAYKFLPEKLRINLLKQTPALVSRYCGSEKIAAQNKIMRMVLMRVCGSVKVKIKRLFGKRMHTHIKTSCASIRFIYDKPYFVEAVKSNIRRKKLFGLQISKKKIQPSNPQQAKPAAPKPAAPKPVIKVNVSYLVPSKRLEGKKILITGGGRGLGYSMAKKFVQEGAAVLIAGRNEEVLKSKAEELGCMYLPLDVQDVTVFPEFMNKAEEMLSGINCLVNNAGISMHETNIRTVTPEGFDAQFSTNLRGAYFLSQSFIKLVESRKRRNCNILFVSSERGFFVDDIPYGLTKVATNSLVQGLAVRLLPSGIRVNGIAPGITTSDMTGFKADGNLYCPYNANKRVYLPDEVSETACFLLADASGCISGQIIACDEGRAINPHWARS